MQSKSRTAFVVTGLSLAAAVAGLLVDVPQIVQHGWPGTRDRTATEQTEDRQQRAVRGIEQSGSNLAAQKSGPDHSESTEDTREITERSRPLNLIIFDATWNQNIFTDVVRRLRYTLPHAEVVSSSDWSNRKIYDRTQILWQWDRNAATAECLVEWIPGEQDSWEYRPWETVRGHTYFGMQPERDIIIFIGQDWWNIFNASENPPTEACR